MGGDRGPLQLSPSQSILSLELTSSDRPRDMAGLGHVTTQSSSGLTTLPPSPCPARAQDESVLGPLQMEGAQEDKECPSSGWSRDQRAGLERRLCGQTFTGSIR